jgi:murein DD-endopeptidase MepM/ murein hydrolase activator NlpD
MANYSKKRPAFRSRTEIYKKSKWQKFKEAVAMFFNNVKRALTKIALKINEKGSQKLTIMMVPHTEKKIVNIQISNYVMFFTLVILVATITTSVVAISDNQRTVQGYNRMKTQNQFKSAEIEEFKRSINSLSERFTHFKGDINDTIRASGTTRNIYDFTDVALPALETNDTLPKEVRELQRLERELEVTKKNISSLGRFIANYKRLLQSIPSLYPLATSARITSPFGPRVDPIYRWRVEQHRGIDMATFPGTPIKATADGIVELAGYHGGYGWMIKIRHKYGFSTRYAHMERFAPTISVGSEVKQGTVIGYVGTSGRSTGYHLHYEVIIGNQAVNPQPFINMQP